MDRTRRYGEFLACKAHSLRACRPVILFETIRRLEVLTADVEQPRWPKNAWRNTNEHSPAIEKHIMIEAVSSEERQQRHLAERLGSATAGVLCCEWSSKRRDWAITVQLLRTPLRATKSTSIRATCCFDHRFHHFIPCSEGNTARSASCPTTTAEWAAQISTCCTSFDPFDMITSHKRPSFEP